jgi:hypothetical protein
MWFIYTVKFYSAIKDHEIMSFTSKISQTQKKTSITCFLSYEESNFFKRHESRRRTVRGKGSVGTREGNGVIIIKVYYRYG